MALLCIIFSVMLAAGGLGVYHFTKRICGSEKTRYLPFAVCLIFLIICAGFAFTGMDELRGELYGEAFEDGKSSAALETEEHRAEAEELRYQAYADGYKTGFSEAMEAMPLNIEPDSGSDTANQADKAAVESKDSDEEENGTADKDVAARWREEGGDGASDDGEEPADIDASGYTVYYTSGGSVLHLDSNCHYLKKASEVLHCDISAAPSRPLCSACG